MNRTEDSEPQTRHTAEQPLQSALQMRNDCAPAASRTKKMGGFLSFFFEEERFFVRGRGVGRKTPTEIQQRGQFLNYFFFFLLVSLPAPPHPTVVLTMFDKKERKVE